jgi:hypothetical protein
MQGTFVQAICPYLPHYTTVGEQSFGSTDGLTLANVADDAPRNWVRVNPKSFFTPMFIRESINSFRDMSTLG